MMAWAAAFQWIEDKHGPGDLVEVGLQNYIIYNYLYLSIFIYNYLQVKLGGNKMRVGETCEFLVDVPDRAAVSMDQVCGLRGGENS